MSKKIIIAAIALLPLMAAAQVWRPATQKVSAWTDSVWVVSETYSTQYTSQGKIASQEIRDEDGNLSSETYTYNPQGMMTTKVTMQLPKGETQWQNSQKIERTYDSRLSSFITFNDQYVWTNGKWQPSNNYKQQITRDGKGNIVKMERSVFYQGIYDPIHRLTVRYDNKGVAYEIATQDLRANSLTGELAWVAGDKFTNIVWEETDGQITSLEKVFEGANRISSAKVIKSDGLEYALTATYSAGGYTSTMTSEDLTSTITFTPLDEYGSYETSTMTDYAEAGIETITEKYLVDAYDNILLNETIYTMGDETELTRMVGEVEYDADKGYPLSWKLTEYNAETDAYDPILLAEYSDYTDAAASIALTAVADALPLYDLGGRKASGGQRGIVVGHGFKLKK